MVLGAAVLAGCVKYHPRPIDAPAVERSYRARSLTDPGLKAFAGAERWPPASLDADRAATVALYYHPDLETARARLRTAEAAVVTAGGRVNPSVGFGGGRSDSPESAVVRRFEPVFTIETGGKRGLRLLHAERAQEAVRVALAEDSWKVRSRARAAWRDAVFARRRVDALDTERQARAAYTAVLEKRWQAGEIGRAGLDVARSGLLEIDAALNAARTDAARTLPELAAAMGVPVAAIAEMPLAEPAAPPPESALPLSRVVKAGLLNRADVRRALAEYAAAEASLKLEIAQQYPDVQLVPGYSFDEGHYKYTFSPAFPVPVLNRNQGPIRAAGARRGEAEARFTALEAQAVAEMDTARARYAAAWLAWREAHDRAAGFARNHEAAVRQRFEAGEDDRLSLDAARVETALAARAEVDALAAAHAALAALEDAVGQPLGKPWQ